MSPTIHKPSKFRVTTSTGNSSRIKIHLQTARKFSSPEKSATRRVTIRGLCTKSRRTDPLPPSAALPLCEGENKAAHFTSAFSPFVRGSREHSERGVAYADFLCKVPYAVVGSRPLAQSWESPKVVENLSMRPMDC